MSDTRFYSVGRQKKTNNSEDNAEIAVRDHRVIMSYMDM